jgi:hypothetical protein
VYRAPGWSTAGPDEAHARAGLAGSDAALLFARAESLREELERIGGGERPTLSS